MNRPPAAPDPEFIDADRLRDIRQQTDWRKVWHALGLERIERKGSEADWWARSPFSQENTASFHVSQGSDGLGRWYCFSTRQGGGMVELVQKLKNIDCYAAGRWLLETGCSRIALNSPATVAADHTHRRITAARSEGKKEADTVSPNQPIRQDLVPRLDQSATHPALVERGISPETCQYLGCGYLPLQGHRSPLRGRLVFQIGGAAFPPDNPPQRVILSHIGRATTDAQQEAGGKWHVYAGFQSKYELYHWERFWLPGTAQDQLQATRRLLLVEGCFDVAKLVEAGIYNVVATFGAHLTFEQQNRLTQLEARFGSLHHRVLFDRGDSALTQQQAAVAALQAAGFAASGFNWEQSFPSPQRQAVPIPPHLTDPAELSPHQLQWMQKHRIL